MVGYIEVGKGIDIMRMGVFISLRQCRKREHRQMFGLSFLDGHPLYIPVNPLMFTGKYCLALKFNKKIKRNF